MRGSFGFGACANRLPRIWPGSIMGLNVSPLGETRMIRILALVAAFALTIISRGQEDIQPDLQGHSWDVFVRRAAEDMGATEIIFVDLLTGASRVVSADGEGHTLTNTGVMYFNRADGGIKLAKADGIIRDHPFITSARRDERIDWVLSADRMRIAWTTARQTDDDQLVTSVHVAGIAGDHVRELLVYGPRPGIRLLPLAFGFDELELLMEVRADGAGDRTPYQRSSGVFALNFAGDQVATHALPGEQSCFCAVGFGRDVLLRLAPNAETMGNDVQIHRISDGTMEIIPAVSRGNYTEAGNLLVSPDDSQAVYALSQISGFGRPEVTIRTVLVLVDLLNLRQRILGSPLPALVQPISWTEDQSAVIFTTEESSASWKLDLASGQAIMVADAVYLGMIIEG